MAVDLDLYQMVDLQGVVIAYGAEYDYKRLSLSTAKPYNPLYP